MLDNAGQLIQILIGITTLIGAIVRGIPEIRKTIQEWQKKEVKNVGGKTMEISAFDGKAKAKYLDLSIVLICSAYFSLVLIDALVISGRNPNALYSLAATLIISVLITIILAFLWYRNKVELGIGWGALITLALLIIAPGGPFFSEGEKGGIAGVNLWLPVPILSLLATTMWIYIYGHPLDRAVSRIQRLKVVIVMAVIVSIGTISLGKQLQFFIERDKRTPDIVSINAKSLLNLTNKWTQVQKSSFYAAASDTYLIGNYYNLSQTIQNQSVQNEKDRKNTIITYLSLQQDLGLSVEEQEKISNEIINMLNNGGGERDIYNYLVKYLNQRLEETEGFDIPDPELIQKYSGEIYGGQVANTLRKLDVNLALQTFENLPREQQKIFLANRLKWIHATGGKENNLTTIPLPGITPEARFNSISLMMIDHALPLQPSKLRTLCVEFNYPPSLADKYCNNPPLIINPFYQYQQNSIDINPASIFPEFETSNSKEPLIEQLSLPTDYEAHLASKEYSMLARILILEKEEDDSIRQIIEKGFNKFDSLDPQVQTAFIYYFTNYQPDNGQPDILSQDIYDAILTLSQFEIVPLDKNQEELDESDIRILSSMIKQGIDPNNLPENSLSDLARKILKIKGQDEQKKIRDLLNIENIDIPVRYLFNTKVFDLTKYLDENLTGEQRVGFTKAISNPISIVAPSLFDSKVLISEKDFPANSTQEDVNDFINSANKALAQFSLLDEKQQENVLHRLAISLYEATGQYSHNIFGLMIIQANSWSTSAGLIVASFLSLPLILLIVFLASYLSKQLTARDLLYQLLFDESSQPDNWQFTVGTPDIIHGREATIRQLRNLASRGWGSIAVVGRRGVGKTRILLEMMRQGSETDLPKTVTAWIATPSRFEEAELIESVLERLTANVENAISRHLGAKPLEIRRFETNNSFTGMIFYVLFWFILGTTFVIMSDRVASDQIISTWFPIFLVSIMSIVALVTHLFNIQPVDLSSWLERDRSSSVHTVLLYRDAKRVLQFLENRKKIATKEFSETPFVKQFLRWLGIFISGLVFFFSLTGLGNSNSNFPSNLMIAVLSILVVSGLLSAQFNRRPMTQGYSLLSLIAEYRGFIDRAVFRIRHGALGTHTGDDFEIVVCIDELDKIIVPSELLAYLRRMKVIFEIPGAYYFLSISEDALHTLYLGAAEGKNEVDSTFDHIIRIPPADCDLGERIANAYLNKHSNGNRDEKIDRVIAAVSYGVPRDIIRRCDEILAGSDIQNIKASTISDDFRKLQAGLAYNERILTKVQLQGLSGKADDALTAVNSYLNEKPNDGKSINLVLSLWVLALISIAIMLKDDDWKELSENLRDIGYRILEERPETLIEELNAAQQKINSLKTV